LPDSGKRKFNRIRQRLLQQAACGTFGIHQGIIPTRRLDPRYDLGVRRQLSSSYNFTTLQNLYISYCG
jgi:hypothetical protein